MRILKFGGSSLATVSRIREVDRIVLKDARRELIVVVSAFQGVTNELIECARLAEKGDRNYEAVWKKIAARHRSVADNLLGKRGRARIRSQIDAMLNELRDTLHG